MLLLIGELSVITSQFSGSANWQMDPVEGWVQAESPSQRRVAEEKATGLCAPGERQFGYMDGDSVCQADIQLDGRGDTDCVGAINYYGYDWSDDRVDNGQRRVEVLSPA